MLELAAFAWLSLVAAAQPPECAACHTDRDVTRGFAASVHADLGCTACHADAETVPHDPRPAAPDCAACHDEAATDVPASVHGGAGLDCAACHGPAHLTSRTAAAVSGEFRGADVACLSCHEETVRAYTSGVHGTALRNGDGQSASCASCHGPAHRVRPHTDPASPVAKPRLPETCGACHANPEFLAAHRVPIAMPVEAFRLSVHGRAIEAGRLEAASCGDCHETHGILPARDPKAAVNRANVPATCGRCHGTIHEVYSHSIHGQASAAGVRDAPVCTDCHGEHDILAPAEPRSLVNPARVSSVTCARCHDDERLAARYNLPRDKVPAFEDSFHGLSLRAGSQTVANCASCHGVHNILPSSDPRSTVHPANLSATCGKCHPGAGSRYAIEAVHVLPATQSEHPVVAGIRLVYWLIIPLTIGLMLVHNGLDLGRKLVHPPARHHSTEKIERMNIHFRVAHWLTMPSFVILAFTGFALTYPTAWWAAPWLQLEGRFGFRGTVHRLAGLVLLAGLAYHVVHLVASARDRRILRALRPRWRDAQDLGRVVRHNLGGKGLRPTFGAFSYAEKGEYWAYLWGTAVMAVTGFLLWFNNFTLSQFPKWVSDAATALHFYEAVLATLAIVVWHLYQVVFDPEVYPMETSWVTGKVPVAHLAERRPAYLARLLEERPPGTAVTVQSPAEVRRATVESEDEESAPEEQARPDDSRSP